jgi:hypothetical protein
VPFNRLAFTTDLTLAFLPARYFNVVHANSVFTHCPSEIIEECFAHMGRLTAPGAIFDFTFYRTTGYSLRCIVRTSKIRKKYGGTSPITRASGKKVVAGQLQPASPAPSPGSATAGQRRHHHDRDR